MDGKHPNRKKDKYNPYTLVISDGHYYLSFKDSRGELQTIEIDEVLYVHIPQELRIRSRGTERHSASN